MVATTEELKVPLESHWKFKTYLVRIDKKLGEGWGRWRDGITGVVGVIDWEIRAAMFMDPAIGEPNFIASVCPERLAMRPAEPDEIQWRPMPSTRRAWHKVVREIWRGPRIDDDEPNIWNYQYGHVYERYPRPFWENQKNRSNGNSRTERGNAMKKGESDE